MTRPQLGVQYTPVPGQTMHDLVRAVTDIEAMGFTCFSLPDHLTRPHHGSLVMVPDPVALLARLAASTTVIRLGTMTLLDVLRLPIQTVRVAATLQQITDGRHELGIGVGWQPADLDVLAPQAAGVDARIDALHATLALVREAWPAHSVLDCHEVAGCAASVARTLAVGVPRPRVVVAAGSRRMLRLAANTADTIALTVPTQSRLNGATPSAKSVADQISVARASRPAGMPPVDFHLQIRSLRTESPESPDTDWWTIGGSLGQIADALHRRAEAGIGYLSVCTEDLNLLEHLVSQVLPLCGD